jgi:ABC-2 type transport system ATP-binding protein
MHLSKYYGQIRALHDVTHDITEHATGLLGPNGAGKSTLIKLLLGLIPPSSGTGEVLGYNIISQPLPIRQNIGYMPESECFIPNMSGITFLTYFGRLSGLSARDAMQRSHEALYYVNIGDERYRLINTYSTGMKQKLKLAQALVHDPPLIFLDEPTTGLDPIGRNEMLGLLKKLVTDLNKNIIFSSHILNDIEMVCDDVTILNNGELIKQGNLEELMHIQNPDIVIKIRGNEVGFTNLLKNYGLNFVIRKNDIAITNTEGAQKKILKAAVESGIQLRSMDFSTSSLEDLFIDIIEHGNDTGKPVQLPAGEVV